MSAGENLRTRVDTAAAARATQAATAGAVVCPACTSSSWVRVSVEHRRHEASLSANPVFPLKDDDHAFDETTTTEEGWFCGVCKLAAPSAFIATLDALFARARSVQD